MSNAGSTTKKPRKDIASAIAFEALLSKSKLYAIRALHAKASKEPEVYQMWAALALELLGKAQLASIHPCLVVETDNTNSLLEACGIETDSKVKTISAHVVFARLKHTVDKFGTPHAKACEHISSRRNIELHSGQAAFVGMADKDWEGQFWSTAQLILTSMDMELESWVGSDSKIPATLASEFRTIKVEAARQRIADARAVFLNPSDKKRSKKDVEVLRDLANEFRWSSYYGAFRYSALDSYWDTQCPACECRGFLGGDKVHEEVLDQDHGSGYETVERYFEPVEFFCPTCDLRLDGPEEMEAAGFEEEYKDEEEREIEYEPDYGND